MQDGISTNSTCGDPILLKCDGRQHSYDAWAEATAKSIFIIDDLDDERRQEAARIQRIIADFMRNAYEEVILKERLHLIIPGHCDGPLNPIKIAVDTMMDIQMIEHNPWNGLLKSSEWSQGALDIICSHLASAMHVERLWYCEDHPDDIAARNYKLKHQGQS